jgi:hypothetical protein
MMKKKIIIYWNNGKTFTLENPAEKLLEEAQKWFGQKLVKVPNWENEDGSISQINLDNVQMIEIHGVEGGQEE